MEFTFFRIPKWSLEPLRLIGSHLKEMGHTTRIHYHGQKWNSLRQSDLYMRWGWAGRLPLTKRPELLINREGIRRVSEKLTARDMAASLGYATKPARGYRELETGVDYIIRPIKHRAGQDVLTGRKGDALMRDLQSFEKHILDKYGNANWYASPIFPKVKEYRVITLGNRVVNMYEKVPSNPDGVVWNFGEGATSKNVKWGSWPKKVALAAIRMAHNLRIDFAAWDILEDAEGNIMVLEGNSAPDISVDYRAKCIAKALVWTAETKKISYGSLGPDPREYGWRDFIHPGVKGDHK